MLGEDRVEPKLQRVFRSMGEPSWWVLYALAANPSGLAPFQLIHQVQDWLRRSEYPVQRLDPGTLHYALPRMEELGVIEFAGEREADVPVGRGSTKREKRPAWSITATTAAITACASSNRVPTLSAVVHVICAS